MAAYAAIATLFVAVVGGTLASSLTTHRVKARAVPSRPSPQAAYRYLTGIAGKAKVTISRVWYDGASRTKAGGYSIYFTVLAQGARSAALVKVCEDAYAKPYGFSNLSAGDPSCD